MGKPLLFSEIKENQDVSILTTNEKFNKWFSVYLPNSSKPKFGGMIKKSVIFVTGSSGAGKTTTMANIMSWVPKVSSVFYARESNLDEIKNQLSPFEIKHNNALFCDSETHPSFCDFMDFIEQNQPEIVIVDSIQAIATEEHRSWKMTKDDAVENIRQKLTTYIKKREGVLFIIGHNTKEGEFAGKNTNMQMVDAHMVLEYDKKTGIRKMYWGQKNRKGPMKTMYYEIHNGEIIYFNPEEYENKILESEKETDIQESKSLLTPKSICEAYIKQFKNKSDFENFNSACKRIISNTLKSYKKTHNHEKAERMAYFNALESIHIIAVNYGWAKN